MGQVCLPGWAETPAHWDGMPRKGTAEGQSARLPTGVQPYGCDWTLAGPTVLSAGHAHSRCPLTD